MVESQVKGVDSDFNRSYVLVDKASAAPLPNPGKLQSAQESRLMDGVSQAVNGAAYVRDGNVWGGIKEMGRGVVNTLRGAGSVLAERFGRLF